MTDIKIPDGVQLSERGKEWLIFAGKVLAHVEMYTVPQYGDKPHDQITNFTEEEFVSNMKRYVNRALTNARGEAEAIRDLLKLAHYAGVLHTMKTNKEQING